MLTAGVVSPLDIMLRDCGVTAVAEVGVALGTVCAICSGGRLLRAAPDHWWRPRRFRRAPLSLSGRSRSRPDSPARVTASTIRLI